MSTHPLASTHAEVSIRILSDEALQRAFVRHDITVEMLIRATLLEFTKEKELNENSDYALSLNGRILPEDALIGELSIQPTDELILGYVQFTRAEAAPKSDTSTSLQIRRLVLVYEGPPRKEFVISNYPAIIGRPGLDDEKVVDTEYLAVDLSAFEDKGKRTVSRKHARLVEVGGKPAIESINPSNPVMVVGQSVEVGERRVLASGDLIRLGNVYLRVTFN